MPPLTVPSLSTAAASTPASTSAAASLAAARDTDPASSGAASLGTAADQGRSQPSFGHHLKQARNSQTTPARAAERADETRPGRPRAKGASETGGGAAPAANWTATTFKAGGAVAAAIASLERAGLDVSRLSWAAHAGDKGLPGADAAPGDRAPFTSAALASWVEARMAGQPTPASDPLKAADATDPGAADLSVDLPLDPAAVQAAKPWSTEPETDPVGTSKWQAPCEDGLSACDIKDETTSVLAGVMAALDAAEATTGATASLQTQNPNLTLATPSLLPAADLLAAPALTEEATSAAVLTEAEVPVLVKAMPERLGLPQTLVAADETTEAQPDNTALPTAPVAGIALVRAEVPTLTPTPAPAAAAAPSLANPESPSDLLLSTDGEASTPEATEARDPRDLADALGSVDANAAMMALLMPQTPAVPAPTPEQTAIRPAAAESTKPESAPPAALSAKAQADVTDTIAPTAGLEPTPMAKTAPREKEPLATANAPDGRADKLASDTALPSTPASAVQASPVKTFVGTETAASPSVSAVTGNQPTTVNQTADSIAAAPAPASGFEALIEPAIDTAAFAPALGARIAVLARDGIEQARLNVHPSDMGPITVQLAMDGNQVRVEFMADMAGTRQTLEQAMPSLASSLRDAGFTLSGGGVSQQSSQAQQQAERGSGNGDNAPGASASPAGTEGVNVTAASGNRAAGRETGLVDLFA